MIPCQTFFFGSNFQRNACPPSSVSARESAVKELAFSMIRQEVAGIVRGLVFVVPEEAFGRFNWVARTVYQFDFPC